MAKKKATAEETVEVELSNPWQGHEVGERITVDRVQGKNLVRAGVATYPAETSSPSGS